MSAPAAVLWGGPHDGRELPHVPERASRIFVTDSTAARPGLAAPVLVIPAGEGARPEDPGAAVYVRTGRQNGVHVAVYEYTPLVAPPSPT